MMSPRRGIGIVAALCALLLLIDGPARTQEPPPLPADLTQRLDALLADPALTHATVGVLVRSLRDNRTLYARNADLALLPASNQKILTAAAALERLGPRFTYRTFLYRTGAIHGSVLRGDLVLRGTGDPSLTAARLGELARALRRAGIRRVTGRIVADDTRFDDRRLGRSWSWDNEPFWYQPQISALNCDGNLVAVTVAPGPRAGAPARVTLRPNNGYVRVRNTVATVKSGSASVVFDRARARNELLLGGALPVGARPLTEELTVEEPSLYAAARLADALRAAGVALGPAPPIRGGTPAGSVLVARSDSEPLGVLLQQLLKRSDNLYAEALVKTLGAERAGKGTFAAGAQIVTAYLRGIGLDAGALEFADGSGLSRADAVTPEVLVGLLAYLHEKAPPEVRGAFVAALPVGGVDGTLRGRFRQTAAAGIVRAKTGTLSGVTSLSGYVTAPSGEPLVFSILMNNVLRGTAGARAVQDALVLALLDGSGSSPPASPSPPSPLPQAEEGGL